MSIKVPNVRLLSFFCRHGNLEGVQNIFMTQKQALITFYKKEDIVDVLMSYFLIAAGPHGHMPLLLWFYNEIGPDVFHHKMVHEGGSALVEHWRLHPLPVFEWLYDVCPDMFTTHVVKRCMHNICSGSGNLETLQWFVNSSPFGHLILFHENLTEWFFNACGSGNWQILKWIYTTCFNRIGVEDWLRAFEEICVRFGKDHLDWVIWMYEKAMSNPVIAARLEEIKTMPNDPQYKSLCKFVKRLFYYGKINVLQWMVDQHIPVFLDLIKAHYYPMFQHACMYNNIVMPIWLMHHFPQEHETLTPSNFAQCLLRICNDSNTNYIIPMANWLMTSFPALCHTDEFCSAFDPTSYQPYSLEVLTCLAPHIPDIGSTLELQRHAIITRPDLNRLFHHSLISSERLNVARWLLESFPASLRLEENNYSCFRHACYFGDLRLAQRIHQECPDLDIRANNDAAIYSNLNRSYMLEWLASLLPDVYSSFVKKQNAHELVMEGTVSVPSQDINDCFICYETPENIRTICNHSFCQDCILSYKKTYNKSIFCCPYCRSIVQSFQHVVVQKDEILDNVLDNDVATNDLNGSSSSTVIDSVNTT